MKAEHINPFMAATTSVYDSVCGLTVERNGALAPNMGNFQSNSELFAVIRLSGAFSGAVIMLMELALARKVIKTFLDEKAISDEDLLDGFGEILNMIVGGATAQLPGLKIEAPVIDFGRNPKVYKSIASPWIVIPMKFTDMGDFSIEVALQD